MILWSSILEYCLYRIPLLRFDVRKRVQPTKWLKEMGRQGRYLIQFYHRDTTDSDLTLWYCLSQQDSKLMALKNRSFLEIGRFARQSKAVRCSRNEHVMERRNVVHWKAGWKFPLLVLFSSDVSLFEMITRWKLFLLPTFIGSIDIRFHVDIRIQPMRQKKNGREGDALYRNVGAQFSRTLDERYFSFHFVVVRFSSQHRFW